MTTIGATGHQDISPAVATYVKKSLRDHLRSGESRSGYTCLAKGADQIFAAELLGCGLSLHVIIPSRDYETTFPKQDRPRYRELLAQATELIHCNSETASEEAYWRAGKAVVNRSDRLIAVWDGAPARGLGGTADIVKYAQQTGKSVTVIWPLGVRRP